MEQSMLRNFTFKLLVCAGVVALAVPLLSAAAVAHGREGSGGYGMMGKTAPGMMPHRGSGMMHPGMMYPDMMRGMNPQSMMGPGMMRGAPMMGRGMIDANGDGLVSAEEAAAAHERGFVMLDADGDDAVSREEFDAATTGMSAYMKQMQQHIAGHVGEANARHMMERMRTRQTDRQERREKRFAAIDADSDGSLTLDEVLRAAEDAYNKADTDGDGRVTVWEYRRRAHH